jgi:hypothetical protein
MIVGSFDRIGAVAVFCGGQTGSAVSADARVRAGRVLCGRGAVPVLVLFRVLLLFAACCGPAAERGRAGGCCFS